MRWGVWAVWSLGVAAEIISSVNPTVANHNCTFAHTYEEWLVLAKAQTLRVSRFETSRSNFAKSVADSSKLAQASQGNSVLDMSRSFFSHKTGLPFDFVMALPEVIGSHSQKLDANQKPIKGLVLSAADESVSMGEYSNAIEIGDQGHDKDDFSIILSQRNQPWEIFAFGFNLLDNSVSKAERLEVLSSETSIVCAQLDIPTTPTAFLGVVATGPIHSVKFIEDADSDNIAVSDFAFGYRPSPLHITQTLEYGSAANFWGFFLLLLLSCISIDLVL
jgi:hypothetical protein